MKRGNENKYLLHILLGNSFSSKKKEFNFNTYRSFTCVGNYKLDRRLEHYAVRVAVLD